MGLQQQLPQLLRHLHLQLQVQLLAQAVMLAGASGTPLVMTQSLTQRTSLACSAAGHQQWQHQQQQQQASRRQQRRSQMQPQMQHRQQQHQLQQPFLLLQLEQLEHSQTMKRMLYSLQGLHPVLHLLMPGTRKLQQTATVPLQAYRQLRAGLQQCLMMTAKMTCQLLVAGGGGSWLLPALAQQQQ
jgi:hypothetical protein